MQLVILHKKTTTDLCLGKSMHKKDASKMHSYLSATDLNKVLPAKFIPHLKLMKLWLIKVNW